MASVTKRPQRITPVERSGSLRLATDLPGLSPRMRADISWGVVGLAVLGVSGFALNVVIARFYNVAVLGAFSQVFAVYVLFAQFAAVGCQYSCVKFIAEYAEDEAERDTVITAAFVLVAVTAATATLLFWLSRGWVAAALDSPAVAVGMAWAAPGLFCFAINKVAMAVVNGQRRMRLYATLQALRPLLLVAGTATAVLGAFPPASLPVVFTVSEGVVLLVGIMILGGHLRRGSPDRISFWVQHHLSFGARTMASGVLLQLNTRVDVLMLALFAADTTVGIYAMAAGLAEGLAQLPIIFRRNFNPLLAQLAARGDRSAMEDFVWRGKRVVFQVVAAVALPAVLVYPWAVRLMTGHNSYDSSWPIFVVLVGGIVTASRSIALRQILLQGGHPGVYSLMILSLCLINAIGNLMLIPLAGALGAAMGTTLAMLASVVVLRWVVARAMGMAI